MVVLAVHTTSPSLCVAVINRDSLLGEVILPPGKEHLENLVPTIRDLTENLGMKLGDLDALAVATGPGSFSGIRIGIACVKGIAIALRKPVVGVSSLEILAWSNVDDGGTAISVIDARRGEIYLAGYKRVGFLTEEIAGPRLLNADHLGEFMADMPEGVALAGDVSLETLLRSIPTARPKIVAAPSAAACGFIACELIRMGRQSELDSLAPLYVRRSDAEEKRGLLSLRN